jgi:cell division protein ZipA
VPAGDEDDIVAFDTMLAKTRRLADELGGEVRDARRSVLTRQAIGQIREQLNEWRCKAQATQH